MDNLPLHDRLIEILGEFEDGTSHCYFEPPSNERMHYPCIVYHQENKRIDYADNKPYLKYKRYSVTIIDEDQDSTIPDRFEDDFMYCSPDRIYCYDDLWHFAYTLYYNGPRIKEENNNG